MMMMMMMMTTTTERRMKTLIFVHSLSRHSERSRLQEKNFRVQQHRVLCFFREMPITIFLCVFFLCSL